MSTLRILQIALVASLSLPAFGWAQTNRLSIQTHLDRPKIQIGERASVDMTIRTDNLEATTYRLMEDTVGQPRFRIIDFAAIDTIDLGGGIKEIKAKLILTSFDSTMITIPPIVVETPSGQVQSKPLALDVVSPQVDVAHPEKIHPIDSPWDESLTLLDLLRIIWSSWISYVLAGLVLVGLILWEYYHRATYEVIEKPKEERTNTYLELCLQALHQAEGLPLVSQEDYKAYYSHLTEALKAYLGAVHQFDAREMTTAEFLDALSAYPMTEGEAAQISAHLRRADQVKFAKGQPRHSEAIEARQDLENFVRAYHLRWLEQLMAQRQETTKKEDAQ